jgi:hypothetical protein
VRVLFTARSVFLFFVFVFFVCFLNERQKANEDAFTGPFPCKESRKRTNQQQKLSRENDKKREPLLSRSRALFIAQSLGLSPLLCLRINEREKGKNITQRADVFFP